jgi:SOS-response transcriptional repressor LexA
MVIVDAGRRPQRGDIVFARIRGRLKVGVLGTQLGRSVLRADTESFWIDHTTDVWGVAVAADPPLDALL